MKRFNLRDMSSSPVMPKPIFSFPKLAALLKPLRLSDAQDVHDLLSGHLDRDFIKRQKTRFPQLNAAIEELQSACGDTAHPIDAGHLKYLLWQELRPGFRASEKSGWDPEAIGASIISQVQAEQDRLVCIPLPGSISPHRRTPDMHPLAADVWLLEATTRNLNRIDAGILIQKLKELVDLPREVVEALGGVAKIESEYGPLFACPLLLYHAKGPYSERGHKLRKFGFPLVALYNLCAATNLEPNDDLSFIGFVNAAFGRAPIATGYQEEWASLSDDSQAVRVFEVNTGASWSGLGVSLADLLWDCKWGNVAYYEIDLQGKRVSSVVWGAVRSLPPHILILPSLLQLDISRRLIDAGNRMDDPAQDSLIRRISHALTMWTRAYQVATEVDWEIGWMHEADETPTIPDPDALILYSTIVLEALSQSGKHEVTATIADFTAALLGNSGEQRHALAKRMKAAYGKRSDFVHGQADRDVDTVNTAIWLFKIATLALRETVRLAIVEEPALNWSQFNENIQKKKFGCAV